MLLTTINKQICTKQKISTNQLNVMVNYDSNTDGHINSYINTSIYPTGNQYVILREAKDK